MSFRTANVRSVRLKMDEIQLRAVHHRSDVLIFTEPWLSQDMIDTEVNLPGYMLARAESPCERAGEGVIIYWRGNLKAHLLDIVCNDEDDFESVWW